GEHGDWYVVPGILTGDQRRDLVVAEEDHHEVLVSIGLDVRQKAAEGVNESLTIVATDLLEITLPDVGGIARWPVGDEPGAVTDRFPLDELWDGTPRRVTGDQCHFHHEGSAQSPVTLEPLERGQGVLVGHGSEAEAGTVVVEIGGGVDAVVAEELP